MATSITDDVLNTETHDKGPSIRKPNVTAKMVAEAGKTQSCPRCSTGKGMHINMCRQRFVEPSVATKRAADGASDEAGRREPRQEQEQYNQASQQPEPQPQQ